MNEDDLVVIEHIKKQQKKLQAIHIENHLQNDTDIIIKKVEEFIKKKKLICYGGTALNNLLPDDKQFYSNADIPDYDFFSTDPINDAKELADMFYKSGYIDVQAKAGMHEGTYKVFVNYFGIADITYLPLKMFRKLQKECIEKKNILYVPPNYLLMMIYDELSSPNGNVSRWEKVYSRFCLFIEYYPLQVGNCLINHKPTKFEYQIYDVIKQITKQDKDLVLIGSHARELYQIFDNDIDCIFISENFDVSTNFLLKHLWMYTQNIEVKEHPSFHKFLPKHHEILINNKSVAVIFDKFPERCCNYNKSNNLKVATTDTLLYLYLLFVYIDKPYLNPYFYLCKSQKIFEVQQLNKTKQTGIYKRFSLPCIGKHLNMSDIKKIKDIKYREIKKSKNYDLYDEWFLNYSPSKQKEPLK